MGMKMEGERNRVVIGMTTNSRCSGRTLGDGEDDHDQKCEQEVMLGYGLVELTC